MNILLLSTITLGIPLLLIILNVWLYKNKVKTKSAIKNFFFIVWMMPFVVFLYYSYNEQSGFKNVCVISDNSKNFYLTTTASPDPYIWILEEVRI